MISTYIAIVSYVVTNVTLDTSGTNTIWAQQQPTTLQVMSEVWRNPFSAAGSPLDIYSTIKWMCFGWLGLTAFNCEKDWWLGRSTITIVWGVQWVDFMGSNLKYLVLVNRATRSTEYSFSACKPTNLCCQFYQYQRAMTPESPIYNQPFDHNHQLIITLTFWPIAEQHCCHNSSKQQHKSKFGISSTMLHNATMNDEPCNQCIFTND